MHWLQSRFSNPVLLALPVSLLFALAGQPIKAQTIQPVISEYTGTAEGRFDLTNDTLTPMAIILEPRSFNISPDGRGIYRALDPGIHVRLSTTSFRLEPKQTYYVFYKASADALPAWFTIYASFSPIHAGDGLQIRILLPHTVYLYQKKPIQKQAIRVELVDYQPQSQTIICDLRNEGPALVRVQEVKAIAGKTSVSQAGFPLLPGAVRHLAIDWKEKARPEFLLIHFPGFDLRESLAAKGP